ncbi:serine/threonine-protein kinase 38-like isoform X1 [Pomacea canaliculata]|uniref:serine/threonine-protein kinase 38-like isoform X1 n=1 Tax=Pomacea canaliculata TaxID=400727 RepID=UPI000D733870|nr:serine/threonine-protein kinase 38-like isoform X1 [Pomacea canaliculata]
MKEIIKKGIYMLREQNVEKEHIVMIKVQCPWTVEFLNLYESPFKQCILMEFIPGRNLLEELVVKKSLTVKQIRVYAAEMLACIFSVHRHGYIHSDIKLTNFMLDSYNHIKCATSGSASSFFYLIQCLELYPPHLNFWEVPDTSVLAQWHEIKDTHVQMFSIPHGTSYYCAPEVIKFTYKNWSMYGNNGFTFTCDFWSYGVCLYYLLFGHLPFYSRDKLQIPRLIIYWEQTLNLKSKRFIPDSGLDLIKKLICDERSRLGANGFHEIACHSFFDNIRWEGLGYRRNPTEIPGPDTLESPDSPEESELACNNFFPFLCRAKKRKETTYSLSMSRQRVSSLRRTEDELSRMSTVQRDGGEPAGHVWQRPDLTETCQLLAVRTTHSCISGLHPPDRDDGELGGLRVPVH